MTLDIRLLCFVIILSVVRCETKIRIGIIYDPEEDLTQRTLQESLLGLVSHGPVYELISERVSEPDHYQVIQAATKLMKKNVLAIVVPSTRGGYSSLISLSNNAQIPLISLSDKPIDEEGRFLINLGPGNLRAILDLMRFYRWSNVLYLYDKDDGPSRLQYLIQLGSGALKLNVLGMYKVDRADSASGLLRKTENENPSTVINVALDLNPTLAANVLSNQARSSSGSKKNFHFIIMDPVDDDIFEKRREFRQLNITMNGIYDLNSPIVEDRLKMNSQTSQTKDDSRTKTLLAIDTANLVDEAFSRLIQNQPGTIESTPSYYKNGSSKFPYGQLVKQYITETFVQDALTGPIQLDQRGERRGFTIYLKESTPQESVDAFTWTDQKGLIPIQPAYAMDKSALTENKTLLVSTVLTPPYMTLKPNADELTGNDRFQGFNKDLLDLISQQLGVEYKLSLSADGRYGSKDTTGKWNGMIGEVVEHKADMALADLTITTSRQTVVDFSIPYLTVGITMLIKKPGGDGSGNGPSDSSYFFFHIFTMDVWGCILVSFIGVGVLYFFVTRLTNVYIDPRTGQKRVVGVLDSLWFSFGSLLLHNTGIYSKSISARFLTAIWWIFVIFIATIYVSGLVSMLLVEMFGSGTYNNYKALSSKTTYSIIKESLRTGVPQTGCVEGGATRHFFKSSNTPTYLQFNEVLERNPHYMSKSNMEGVERVRNGNGQYAFLMESSTAEYTSYKYCDVAVVPQQLDTKGYGIAFNKGSAYRDLVNNALLKIMERGDLQTLYLQWWVDGSQCFKKQERSYTDLYHTAMTLKSIGGLFYCLITGVVLTLFVTAVEYCVKKRRRGHHSVALTQMSKGDDLNGDHEIHHSSL